jgi:transketolase
MSQEKIESLKSAAAKVRIGILDAVFHAQSGHPGGSLSCADILTALYFEVMNIDPKNPHWEDRDRFVLSKGHCSPCLYSVLANRGYFSVQELKKFRQIDSFLQGHPDLKKVPGVDMSTGSLGQGLSVANGMAYAAKMDNKNYRVYAVMGDGESEEGQIWEAAMFAAHYKLDNITVFLDHNHLQIDGFISKVMSPEPLDEKFKAFGWHVISINGHDFSQILNAIDEAKNTKDKPTMIICETVKGKGVPFMENLAEWHGKAPNEEQYKQAVACLTKPLKVEIRTNVLD